MRIWAFEILQNHAGIGTEEEREGMEKDAFYIWFHMCVFRRDHDLALPCSWYDMVRIYKYSRCNANISSRSKIQIILSIRLIQQTFKYPNMVMTISIRDPVTLS